MQKLLATFALCSAVALAGACTSNDSSNAETKTDTTADTAAKTAEKKEAAAPAPKAPAAAGLPASSGDNPKVLMETTLGNIELELFKDKAPVSTQNFVAYAKDGAYNGTVFHRVISNFMIQGGGFDKDLKKQPTKAPIVNESNNGVPNVRGTISMARTSAPNSATNQFFINVKDNPNLDSRGGRPGYAVFGKVTNGMDVVDKIRNVQTGSCPPMFRTDCPQTPVIIKKVELK